MLLRKTTKKFSLEENICILLNQTYVFGFRVSSTDGFISTVGHMVYCPLHMIVIW